MKYDLTLVKPADLFFTTSSSLISNVIRFRTWGKFSHVQIVTKQIDDNLEVITADAEGVMLRNAREEEWENFAILTCPEMLSVERQNVLKFCFSQIGKEYDFVGLSSFLLYKQNQNYSKWFCSELAYVAYKQAGIRLQRRLKQDFVSPRDLYLSPLLKDVIASQYDWT